MRTYLAAKLHRITVTDASLHYIGSVTICAQIMETAGIAPYEQVHIVNLSTGHRWITYAVPTDRAGEFALNGGGARLGEPGDRCVVMTYRTAHTYQPARALLFGAADNQHWTATLYDDPARSAA